MFSDIGSAASLVGLVVSLLGLGFAILQLRKLRGETRAAREAAEAAERAVQRDLTISELASLREKVQDLKEAHRRGDRSTAFVCYRDVKFSLVNIELRHPSLTDTLRGQIQIYLSAITNMERFADSIDGGLALEQVSRFNNILSDLDSELVTELQRRMPGGS